MEWFQSKLRRLVERVMSLSLVNRWIVLFLDMILSVLAYSFAINMRSQVDSVHQLPNVEWWGGVFLICNGINFYLFKSYTGLIRHTNLRELWRLFAALFTSCFAFFLAATFFRVGIRFVDFLTINMFMFSLSLMLGMRLLMVFVYSYTMNYSGKHSKKTLVYGNAPHSVAIAQWLNGSSNGRYLVQGFLVRNKMSGKARIIDLPVYDLNVNNANWFMRKNDVTTILFPDYKSMREEQDFVTQSLSKGLSVMVSPPFEGADEFGKKSFQMKKIQFEDLLGRDEIEIDMAKIGTQVGGKVILVTGAAGSIGSELVRQLAIFKPKKLILFDSAETPLHHLRLELEELFPDQSFELIVGDVRSNNRLGFVFRKFHPQVVYHAAAYKHVPLMEENPCEAVLVNVLGTKNLSTISAQYGVESFVMISTDKAVNPTNVMGASKRIAEIFVQSLAKDCAAKENPIRFVTTRFGNVLGSNGSVIPHFKEQIEKGGPVTVTHKDIIRYFMTIPEACRLVLEAASFGKSGEIYVFDMGEPVKIVDLARKMIEMAGLEPDQDIEIKYTGLRPGEKLYEELLNVKETTLPTEHDKITVATVRQYDFEVISGQIKQIIECAHLVDVPDTIRNMKLLVPEFLSQNSPFEIYDSTYKESLIG